MMRKVKQTTKKDELSATTPKSNEKNKISTSHPGKTQEKEFITYRELIQERVIIENLNIPSANYCKHTTTFYFSFEMPRAFLRNKMS
jgi:hypothetical protein